MITFEGSRQVLKPAKLIESKAKNIYPHISTSRFRLQLGYGDSEPEFFTKMKKRFCAYRKMYADGGDLYSSIAYSLSESKIGNCLEEAFMAKLIGAINGQKNIYVGNLCIKNDNWQLLNHVVAFVTDKSLQDKKITLFKNKDAVIIDPWLGVTDFAGSYFAKLKTIYRKYFTQTKNSVFATFSDDKSAMEAIKKESKNINEFREKRKNLYPNSSLGILPLVDKQPNDQKIEKLKILFPELVIKDYKQY